MNFVLGNECTPCMSNTTSYLQAGHRIRLPPFLEFLIGSDLLSKIFWQQTWHKLWLHGKSTTGGFSLSRHSWQLVILSYLTSEQNHSKTTRLWPWVCISCVNDSSHTYSAFVFRLDDQVMLCHMMDSLEFLSQLILEPFVKMLLKLSLDNLVDNFVHLIYFRNFLQRSLWKPNTESVVLIWPLSKVDQRPG